jgi:hypothetical protein
MDSQRQLKLGEDGVQGGGLCRERRAKGTHHVHGLERPSSWGVAGERVDWPHHSVDFQEVQNNC